MDVFASKKNRSGVISVQVIDKSSGKYRLVKTIGSSSDAVEVSEWVKQAESRMACLNVWCLHALCYPASKLRTTDYLAKYEYLEMEVHSIFALLGVLPMGMVFTLPTRDTPAAALVSFRPSANNVSD